MEKRAAGIIRQYKLEVEPGDLISETFIKHGEIDEDDFAIKMRHIAGNDFKVNRYKENENKVHDDRRCRKCGEIKQAAWFRTWFLRGYLIFDSYCKPCKNEIINNYKKLKRLKNKEV